MGEGENMKERYPFLFYKPKSWENEALGPSKTTTTTTRTKKKNGTWLLNYRTSQSRGSSRGMDAGVDSSKTLMERVVWLVL